MNISGSDVSKEAANMILLGEVVPIFLFPAMLTSTSRLAMKMTILHRQSVSITSPELIRGMH